MPTIKENIANNIVALRKSRDWTQAELADMLNYSDKTISKWERGESTPDVEMIYQMSQLFDVPIEYFFKENETITEEIKQKKQSIILRNVAQILLWIIVVFFFGTCIFIYQEIGSPNGKGHWLSFIWPVPISFIIITIHVIIHKYFKCIPYSLSGIVWSVLTSIYLTMIVFGMNVWLIFIVGIPIELIIIISYWLKK